MSYDFSMYTTAGSKEKVYTDLDLNYTYNVAKMFCKALEEEDGINIIDGKTGEETREKLLLGIKNMGKDFDDYRKMNPSNGWGHAEGALRVLIELYVYASKYPKAIFEVN